MQHKNKNNFQWNQLIWKKRTKCTLEMFRIAFALSIESPFFSSYYLFPSWFIRFMLIMSSIRISFSFSWCRKRQNWMNELSMWSTEYGVRDIYKATAALLSPVKPHSIKPSIVLSSIKHLISLRFFNKISSSFMIKIWNEWIGARKKRRFVCIVNDNMRYTATYTPWQF